MSSESIFILVGNHDWNWSALLITSVADLLRELMVKEAARLDRETITHAPTIGAMYEGLTRDILDRAIPASLDLRIVDGFIGGIDGALSPQTDAMLVTGTGRALPYSDSFVWPIGQVIAVLEIKKNLFGSELKDAFVKMQTVMRMQNAYVCSMTGETPDTGVLTLTLQRAGAITGVSVATLRRDEKADRLRFVKLGGRSLVEASSLQALLFGRAN